jgi:DNA-binding transcriptional ArsR family regulator
MVTTLVIAPHDHDVERGVLGTLLATDGAGLDRLAPADFDLDHHRTIFAAIREVAAVSGRVDMLAVGALLRQRDALEEVGGLGLLVALCDEAVVVSMLPTHLATLRAYATRRATLSLGLHLQHAAENGHDVGALLAETQTTVTTLATNLAPAPARRLSSPVTLAQMAKAPPPKPRWLVEGLILEAANGWIGAGAKVGKSYLALDLLLSCCLGKPWLGHFAIAEPLTVVLIEEEDSAWRTYERASRLCAGRGVAMPDNFHVLIRSGLQLDDPATLDPFLRWLATARAHLCVWDVFNRLHTKNEKQPEQMMPILRRVDRIRDELGLANLIAHHGRKPSTSGPDLASGGQKLRGPSEFHGWAENSLYLAPLKGKGVVVVEPESKDAISEPFKAHLEDTAADARRWVYDGVVQAREAAGTKVRQAILAALAEQPMTAEGLATTTGKSTRTVKSHLAALAKDGAVDSVKQPGRGGTLLWMLLSSADEADPVPF